MPHPTYPQAQHMLMDDRTRHELGAQGVQWLVRRLWIGDCQSCNRPLGDALPALLVSDFGAYIEAGLHHAHCRAPGWHDKVILDVQGTATYIAWPTLLPVRDPDRGRRQHLATVLVNPSVERVELIRGRDGTWRTRPRKEFGFTPLGEVAVWEPNPQAQVTLTGTTYTPDTTAVELSLDGDTIWTFELGTDGSQHLREHQGLLVVVSNDFDPRINDDSGDLRALVLDMFDRSNGDAVWATLTT